MSRRFGIVQQGAILLASRT